MRTTTEQLLVQRQANHQIRSVLVRLTKTVFFYDAPLSATLLLAAERRIRIQPQALVQEPCAPQLTTTVFTEYRATGELSRPIKATFAQLPAKLAQIQRAAGSS